MHSNWLIPLALGMVGGACLVKICPKINTIIDNTTEKAKEKMCNCSAQNQSSDDESDY